MSDKPLVQQALASELAELVLTITSNIASIAFLRGFWHTLVREWSGIDQLRCVSVLRIRSLADEDAQTGQILHARSAVCECFIPSPSKSQVGYGYVSRV